MKLIFDAIIISSFWFIALYTFNLSNIHRIAINNLDNNILKKIILIAKGVILIWMLTELCLLINENSIVFLIIRDVINTPVTSHVLYAANLLILFNSTIVISSKALEPKKYIINVEKKSLSFINGMFVIALSILVFNFQCVYWGELNYIYTKQGEMNLQLEAIVDGFFIGLPAIIIMVNAIRYLRKEKIRKLAFRISVPIVLLLSFTQTIMTKLIVLNDIIRRLQKYILKQLNKKSNATCEDPLLIASSLSVGTTNAKINAYYLCAYFFDVMILWTLQASPFPYTKNIYGNSTVIVIFISLAILLFWLLEESARLSVRYGNYFRWLFIPAMLILTVYPFYTENANINYIARVNDFMSIYHKMAFTLGANKFLFFLFLAIMQGSLAYIFHLITGEAHNDRHCYSVMPIVFIMQLLMLSIMFPVILSIPPYTLNQNSNWYLLTIFILGIILTLSISKISYNLFTSKVSEWSLYVNEYWKDKQRLYILVTLITIFTFTPLASIVLNPIHNINIELVLNYDYKNVNDSYHFTELIKGIDEETFYILKSNGQRFSKLLSASTVDGNIKWEKTYTSEYTTYHIWPDETIVMVKAGKKGFTVISLRTGKKVYDYTAKSINTIEFLNIEVNDRAVLMTDNLSQILYDKDYGEIKLDILGNNFYELIQGDQCALKKSDMVFIYRNNRLEAIPGIYDFSQSEFIYYDENGMIVFNNKNIFKYSYSLQEKNKEIYLKLFDYNTMVEGSYYKKYNDLVAFYMDGQNKHYAYEFNTKNFTYKIISLEQRIKEMGDLQRLILCDDKGQYLFYDDYQVTLFEHENIVARQWFQLPLDQSEKNQNQINVVGSPIWFDGKIAWLDNEGLLHMIRVSK